MNGAEMMMNAMLKNLGINPAEIIGKAKEIGDAFTLVNTRLETIEKQQAEILSLLRGDMPIIIPALPNENTERKSE